MADIKLGASALDGFYIGSTAVDKVYLGDVEIFSATVPSSNVYPYDNAVGPNDIDSNTGWAASSTFFANSMTSTDTGQNFSIGIEARSTNASNTGYRANELPGLTVGTRYRATIRYKNTSVTTPVQHPMNSWREVSDVIYPGGIFSTGQWVEAVVYFTPNDLSNDAEMRFYPLANAAGGRTVGDLLEISSIIVEEHVELMENVTFDDSTGVNIPSGGWTVSGGLLNYTAGGAKKVRLNLVSDMIVGNTYDISFTISNAGTARIAWYAGNQNETIESNTNYGNGTHTIRQYTHTGTDRGEVSILAQSSGGGTTFSIDNISIIEVEPEPILELFEGNAAADTHGEVNSTTGFSTLGNTSVAVNSTDQQFGSYCIELENGAAGGGFDRVEYDITVENGAQYDVSIWARELVGSDGRIQLWDGVTGWSTVVLTNTWTEYSATVTATSTTMKMRFYPNNGSGVAGDKILLDNISVTKV